MSSTVAANSPSTNTNQQTISNTSTLNTSQQQDNGEPPFLAVGTEVSAKYKGAFCEATIQKVERLVKCRVTFKNNHGTAIVIDDNIRGNLRIGASIEAKHPDFNNYIGATISKIIDASQYTVIFDDGDITTLRRTSLCLKSGKHFAESESLDHLPLTNPEHFGNPVNLNSRSNRRRRRRSAYSTTTAYSQSINQFSDNDDNDSIEDSNTSVDDEDSSSIVTQSGSTTSNFKLNSNSASSSANNGKDSASSSNSSDLGRVVCVDYGDKRSAKSKDLWFPGLVVSHTAQADNSNKPFDLSQDCLIKSFSNGRFYQIKRKDLKEFTKEIGNQILNDNSSSTSLKSAIEKALTYLDKNDLPSSWDYETLIGSNSISLNENDNAEDEHESSDDLDSLLGEECDLDDAKSVEVKDRFVAQLYKYMDERGTPINKTPTIWGDDLDLYNLYRLVIKMGGYNQVCNKNGWKAIYNKLNLPSNEVPTQANANQLKLAYKKYLLNFVDFFRKLGCTMVEACMYNGRTSNRIMRVERTWRSFYDPAKQQQIVAMALANKDKAKRKKSTNESTATNDKKEDDDKKNTVEKPSSNASSIKRPRKNSRKKLKLESDDSNVNGNEPEEKYIPNDSDFESDNDSNFSTPTISKDVTINVGDRVRVKYGKGKQLKVYEAKVMNILNANEKFYVHYTGWNTRYDEWIKRSRIVEVVCDNKSPKRRGGNKLKNKGVPLTVEEQISVPIKSESQTIKVEASSAAPPVSNPGKRGRPPSVTNFRNNQEKQAETATATNSSSSTKVKTEPSTNSNNNKKVPATSPIKRSRQRSECVETDQDEIVEKIEATSTKDLKKDSQQSVNIENEKTEIDNEEELPSDTATKGHQQQAAGKRGYKKVKRDSLRKEEKQDVETEISQPIPEDSDNGQKVVEDDQINKRKQRKKKNDKSIDQPNATMQAKEEEIKQSEQPVDTATVTSTKKRKAPQAVSSDEDDSSNSSTSNTVSSNLNKFSKRKRILNSKYRQDNTPLNSKTESITLPVASQSTKETELPRKRSSKEEQIKFEKVVEETPQITNNKTTKSASNSDQLDVSEVEIAVQPSAVSTTAIEVNSNFLLCKEEIPTASLSCDESNPQPKNSNTSDQAATTHNHPKESSTTQSTTPISIKLCSTTIIDDSTSKESSQTINTSSKQVAPSSSNSITNEPPTNKKDTEEPDCTQQFTPPTTPESLKSNSTSSSHLNEKEDNKPINDKTETGLQTGTDRMETHGLNMIAIASGVSKMVEIEKQNDDKKDTESTASVSNFSPRKKRRGRGRTLSQSESANNNCNVTNNLFNTSFTSKEKEVVSALKDSMHKVKGCKTRGSLGRKVKQIQSNLDCMSESTSHSDNFEAISPASMLLNCVAMESYNPTSRYNFCTPLDENLEADRRIQILHERMQELRKTYLNIKSELATIERRRKKFKRKERSTPSSPGSQSENINKTNSPSSSSSTSTKDNQHNTIQRSNSFTQSPTMECNEQQSPIKEIC